MIFPVLGSKETQGVIGQGVRAPLPWFQKEIERETGFSGFGVWSDWPDLNDLCVRTRVEVFNPAPGDPLSWKVYFQPASAHLAEIFKLSRGA